MKLAEKIERAFAERQMPLNLVEAANLAHPDSDVEDALWFTGRDWHELRWQDWQGHSSAIYFFVPDAFAYYLPSVMILSLQNPAEELMVADALISELDCSPDPEGWTDALVSRFLLLNRAELDVMREWLLQLCEYAPYKSYGIAASGPGDKFGRAFDTLDLLQKEVERRRVASG
jgi:hypothetical protein